MARISIKHTVYFYTPINEVGPVYDQNPLQRRCEQSSLVSGGIPTLRAARQRLANVQIDPGAINNTFYVR
jgi:hypothetical protein